MAIRTGSQVSWPWGNGTGKGKVTELHHERVERTVNGSSIARNGTDQDPALVIEQDDGSVLLKLRSEVDPA